MQRVMRVPVDEQERRDDAVRWGQSRMQRGYGTAGGEEEVCVVRLEGR